MKCAVITGASAGIGLAAAQRFLDEGYAVANLSRRPCPLPAVRQISCDLSAPGFLDVAAEQLRPLLSEAEQAVLIHNASKLAKDSAADTLSRSFREILEINLIAPNALNRFAIPFMQPGSSILYVGSTLGEKAVAGSFSYIVSKHGLIGMMRATCQDLAGRGIHTACICPGFTDTEMLRSHVPQEALDAVRGLSSHGRLIAPAEIAETLFWAAQNPVIDGATLHANLGQLER